MTLEDDQEPERRRRLFEDVVVPGAMAGALGAAVMALLAMSVSAIVGEAPWRPAVLVAGVFFRSGAPQTPWAVLLGIAIHFAVAIGLATAFAMMLPRRGTQMAAMLLGIGFGLTLQVLMPQLIVPYVDPPLARAASGPALLLLHLAFGASLGLVPVVRALLRPRVRVVPAHS
jgi:hypothetical protein